MRYSADVGTVTMTVFRERKSDNTEEVFSEDAAKRIALEKARFPKTQPESFEAMKSVLLPKRGSKGLIVDGDEVGSEVKRVSFTADPVPVMTLTVVYYHGRG